MGFCVSGFAQTGKYENPDIKCEANGREKAMRSYPYKKPKTGQAASDVKGLAAFDEKMREKFSDSEVDSSEALLIYQLLEREQFLKDESYGMPGKGQDQPSYLKVEQLQKRLALRKRAEGVYDLLFYKIGCGKRFFHLRIYVKNQEISKRQQIESWQASYPC